MKLCPECGKEVSRRVDGKCPECGTELELIKGEYFKKNHAPPVEELTRMMEKAVKGSQNNIFPYRIPQHMIVRTKKIMQGAWEEYFPIMDGHGISAEEAIRLFSLAIEDLIDTLPRDSVELGLLLWYVSGKDTNKFQRILTKYVLKKERLLGTTAEVDDWM